MTDPMQNPRQLPDHGHANDGRATNDEGGLSAPTGLGPLGRAWWWLKFTLRVNAARFRFIAILLAIGAVIASWDTLRAYYEKFTRPSAVTVVAASDLEFSCPMHPTVVRDHPDHPEANQVLADYHQRRGELGLANFYRLHAGPVPAREPAQPPTDHDRGSSQPGDPGSRR